MRLDVKVIPRSSQEKVTELGQNNLKVYVHAAPEDGLANEAVIRLLAEHLGVPRRALRIVKGEKSRKKVVEIN